MAEGKVGDIKLSILLNTSEAAKSLGAFVSIINRSFKEIAKQAGIKIDTTDLDRLENELRQVAGSESQAAREGDKLESTLKRHKPAVDQARSGWERFKDTVKKVGIGLAVANQAIEGVRRVINFLKRTLGDFIQESNIAEEAEARLTGALKIYGRYSREVVKDIQRLATERQKITKFNDDETISAVALLETFDIEIDQLKEAVPLLQDLAVMTAKTTGTQMDLEGAAKMVGVGIEGQLGLFKRAGIVVSDEYSKKIEEARTRSEKLAVVFDIIRYNAEGLAVSVGQTGSAAFTKLSNAIDNQKERIGDYLKSALAPLANKMAEIIFLQDLESAKLVDERSELTMTKAVLRSYADQEALTAGELKNRNRLISQLKDNYPGYFANLDSEKSTYDQLAAAIDRVNNNLQKKIQIQVYAERMTELQRQALAYEDADIAIRQNIESLTKQKEATGQLSDQMRTFSPTMQNAGGSVRDLNVSIAHQEKLLTSNRQKWNNLIKQIEGYQERIDAIEVIEPLTPAAPGSSNLQWTDEQKTALLEIEEIEARRAGIAAEIALYEQRRAALMDRIDNPAIKLQILHLEEKITELKNQQKDLDREAGSLNIRRQNSAQKILDITDRINQSLGEMPLPHIKSEAQEIGRIFDDWQMSAVGVVRTFSSSMSSALIEVAGQSENAADAFHDAWHTAIQAVAQQIISNGILLLLGQILTGGGVGGLFGPGSWTHAAQAVGGKDTSVLGLLLGFGSRASGGYAGTGSDSEPAGLYHRNEYIFESAITKNNLQDLAALRGALQKGMTLKDIMRPIAIPVSAMTGGGMGDSTAIVRAIKEVSSDIKSMDKRIGDLELTVKSDGRDLYSTVKFHEGKESKGK